MQGYHSYLNMLYSLWWSALTLADTFICVLLTEQTIVFRPWQGYNSYLNMLYSLWWSPLNSFYPFLSSFLPDTFSLRTASAASWPATRMPPAAQRVRERERAVVGTEYGSQKGILDSFRGLRGYRRLWRPSWRFWRSFQRPQRPLWGPQYSLVNVKWHLIYRNLFWGY